MFVPLLLTYIIHYHKHDSHICIYDGQNPKQINTDAVEHMEREKV